MYAYSNINFPRAVIWTAGLTYDDYGQEKINVRAVSPKIGAKWNITENLSLRFAALQTVKPALIASQTIQPTQVSGFNQFFDDINGTRSWLYGVGLDAHLMESLYGGAEFYRRDLSTPVSPPSEPFKTADQNEDLYRAYLYWMPHPEWAVSADIQFDRFRSSQGGLPQNERGFFPSEVDTFSVPLSLLYFSPLGFFGGMGATYVHQHVREPAEATLPEGSDSFVLLNSAIGYRFPERRGLISLEARNILDTELKFQDDSFREYGKNEAGVVSRYLPKRTILARPITPAVIRALGSTTSSCRPCAAWWDCSRGRNI